MKERGQVFTLDMLFALILIAAFISVSGQAYGFATGQTRSYSTRYSLERTANDAADVLVKTLGTPSNWEDNLENLETPGLAKAADDNTPIQNALDIHKLTRLRALCKENSWPVGSVSQLFGNTDKFEVRVTYRENTLFDFWPGWDNEDSSGIENSLEVATVKRLVFKRRAETVRGTVGGLRHLPAEPGGKYYTLRFFVYSGELDLYDWYIFIRPSAKNKPTTKIWVNRTGGSKDYEFPPRPDDNLYRMRYHGTDFPDNALTDVENDGNPNNFLRIKVTGNPTEYIDVYIVYVPQCTSPELVPLLSEAFPATIEVKVWR